MKTTTITALAIVSIALCQTSTVKAADVTIDFESFAPGFYSSSFLSAQGIPDMIIGGSSGAAGPLILDFPVHLVPSGVNAFIQHHTSLDSGQVQSVTFVFSPPLTKFSLSRLGSAVSSTPAWTAIFLDGAGGTLGSFGEPAWQNIPPVQQFSFTAPAGTTIHKMKLESVWTVTTFRNIPVDDFVLTPVPDGDANGDGDVDFDDVEAFIVALFDQPSYDSIFGIDPDVVLDMDGSGALDFADVELFIAALF